MIPIKPLFPKALLRYGLFTAVAFSASLSLQAQTAPAKLWDKTLGGSGGDNLSTLKQTLDGGYIMGGTSNSGIGGDKSQASKGATDYWLVKTDASGNKTWDKTFGGSADESFRTLQQTADGGYIIGGYSNSGLNGDKSQASKGDNDYWIVKLDASGNKIWDKTFGGSAEEKLFSVQQTIDGGYILGGASKSGISGDKSQASQGQGDFWLVKLDANGNKIWDKSFGGSGLDELYTLQQTADGGYILGGNSNSGIGGDKSQAAMGLNDYWVIKVDATGTKTWDKTFGGTGDDVVLFSIQQTTDGGFVVGGSSASGISGDKTEASKGGNDFWVVKLNASGTKTWDKTLGGSAADNLRAMQQTADGGFILGGYSTSGISGDKSQASLGLVDFWVVKLNASGNKTWDKSLGGSGTDNLNSLCQTTDGGFLLGGTSDTGLNGDKSQASKGGTDFWVVKLDAPAAAAPNDVAVSAISGVNSGCGLTSQETITITITNHGTTAQSNIPVSYKLNTSATPVNEVVPGPIAAGATATYSFTTKADLSTLGTYSIEAKTNLTGDALTVNDAFTKVVTAYAIPNAPVITALGASTLCTGGSVALNASSSSTGVTYQWYLNGTPIAGATSANYTANANGSYTATAIVAGNCSSPASAATVLTMTTIPNAPALSANGPLSLCLGGSVTLNATAGGGTAFTWFKNGNVIPGVTAGNYTVTSAGSYTVTATLNGCGSPVSAVATVTINPAPGVPTVTQAGFLLTSSSPAGNQWYKNAVLITGATNNTFTTTSNGAYTVVVTSNGCSSAASNAVNITTTSLKEDMAGLDVMVFPNPSSGMFNLTLQKGQIYEIVVTDLTGKEVLRQRTNDTETQVNLSKAAKGMYVLKLESEGKTAIRKLIVE